MISYNSCRNRHCPKCQAYAKELWIYERSKSLLPTHYFHIVFTIPEQLNSLTLFNEKEMYSILFNSVSETLLELAKDFKWRDYKDKNKEKVMSLKPTEFIRRFTMHILPDRFVKIRHYGILEKRNKKLKFKRCLEIFRVKPKEFENLSSAELFFKLTDIKIGK